MNHESDINTILGHRYANGADFWSGPGGRIYVGSPFSTLSALGMLYELGVGPEHEAVKGGLALIVAAGEEDGRIRLGPNTPLYSCYTAEAARILCRFGLTDQPVLQRSVAYLLAHSHESGGWRCNYSRFGRGTTPPRPEAAAVLRQGPAVGPCNKPLPRDSTDTRTGRRTFVAGFMRAFARHRAASAGDGPTR